MPDADARPASPHGEQSAVLRYSPVTCVLRNRRTAPYTPPGHEVDGSCCEGPFEPPHGRDPRICRVCGETACGGACEHIETLAAADPEPEWWHDY